MKKNNYAKINLALNVIDNKKPSNYHELDMINVTISLKDSVKIKFIKNDLNETIIKCNNESIPVDNTNLVYKVIEKFKKVFSLSFSCFVYINKKIPISAGLAGGSGNASATLDILNQHFKTNMSLKQKMKFIENITTDGPYMLVGLPCRVKGNGNIISPIKYNLKAKMLIVKPKLGCNTKEVFSSLDYKKLKRYNINKIQEALNNNDLDLLSSHIGNSLLPSAININKDILDVINRMKTCGFEIVSMSGSGSTCFAISKRKYPFKKAKEIFDKEKYDLIKVCKIIK